MSCSVWQCIMLLMMMLLISMTSWQCVQGLSVEGQLVIPDGSNAAGYELTLNGNLMSTVSKLDGSFKFHDVPSGIYLLDVLAIHEIFPQAKLKVESDSGSITVVEYKYPGAKRMPVTYPIVLTALAPNSYFQQRPPFNVIGYFLGNPMMLMMLFSVGVMFLMPMLTAGMDEEQLKEMQKAEDPMKNLQKLMGMESKTNDDDDD